MRVRSLLSSAAVGLGLAVTATPAAAFGPICVPTIYNCMCTYQVPCPVVDTLGNTREALEGAELLKMLKAMQDIRSPQDLLVKAMRGELPGTIPGLDALGVDVTGLTPDALASLGADGLGIDGLESLGIDADTITKIATGKIPVEELEGIASAAGIDPGSFSIPGIDGPITIDTERALNGGNMISIPVDSIPGLQDALDKARGAVADAAKATGSEALLCAADMSLISVEEPPNGFGTDIANIDMAISGGNIDAFPENLEAAERVSKETMIRGFARSHIQPVILARAAKSIDDLEAMIEGAQSLDADFAANDTVKAQLMTARAETASMLTAVASAKAASRINRENISPVPLFPHDSEFQRRIESIAGREDNAAADAAVESKRASALYAKLVSRSREALLQHNLIVDAVEISENLPEVRKTVRAHEAIKSMLIQMEGVIIGYLDPLYEEGGRHVWEILRPQLEAASGTYTGATKYERGHAAATRLSLALTAETPATAYGTRKLLTWYPDADYVDAAQMPSSYAFIDGKGVLLNEPYRIVDESGSAGVYTGRGEEAEATGLELANGLQYYLEVLRRMNYAAKMRRGPDRMTMTSLFWNEMITNAPRCLEGPLRLNERNLAERPELFDLSPDCSHLIWSGGDPGDYIDGSELGGTDSILWMSKISLDRVASRTGGSDSVSAELSDVLDFAERRQVLTKLQDSNQELNASHAATIIRRLRRALDDTSYTRTVEFPLRSAS